MKLTSSWKIHLSSEERQALYVDECDIFGFQDQLPGDALWYLIRQDADYSTLIRTCPIECLEHDASNHTIQRMQPQEGHLKWFVKPGSKTDRYIEAAVTAQRLLDVA